MSGVAFTPCFGGCEELRQISLAYFRREGVPAGLHGKRDAFPLHWGGQHQQSALILQCSKKP
jgi:hypothetical protein